MTEHQKARRNSSSKPIAKRSSLEKEVSVKAEIKPNKHRSYIKIWKDKETDDYHIGTSDGEDLFYCGTHDMDLINSMVDQIINMYIQGKKSTELTLRKTNAALASILEIDPQDSTELMLATQMVSVHNIAMEMSRRALLAEQTEDGVNFNINRMTKLMRTYTSQVEALNKYRNKGNQQITVQHVNVNNGGQAVVGNVNKGGG